MATVYRTMQGEMVDAICTRAYGDESGYVEAVLEANPTLASLPAILPAGTRIALPDLRSARPVARTVSLWD